MIDLLFVITDLAIGGAENQVQDLALLFSQKGWRVAIVSMMAPSISTRHLADAGVEVEQLGIPRGSWNPIAIARLCAIIRRRRPTIVHSHMIHANLLARLTRVFARMPVLSAPPTRSDSRDDGRKRCFASRIGSPTRRPMCLTLAWMATKLDALRQGIGPHGSRTASTCSDSTDLDVLGRTHDRAPRARRDLLVVGRRCISTDESLRSTRAHVLSDARRRASRAGGRWASAGEHRRDDRGARSSTDHHPLGPSR